MSYNNKNSVTVTGDMSKLFFFFFFKPRHCPSGTGRWSRTVEKKSMEGMNPVHERVTASHITIASTFTAVVPSGVMPRPLPSGGGGNRSKSPGRDQDSRSDSSDASSGSRGTEMSGTKGKRRREVEASSDSAGLSQTIVAVVGGSLGNRSGSDPRRRSWTSNQLICSV